MALGKPLVCNTGVGDTDRIVENYEAGTLISEFSESAYQEARVIPSSFDPERIKQGAKEYFSLDEGVKRYLNVYREING